MIDSPLVYLFTLALLVAALSFTQIKTKHKFFEYIPVVVLIYAFSMLLASLGVFAQNQEMTNIYRLTKTNLLPAMLFLMLLEVDFKHFFKLGKSLLIAYALAVFSIAFAFIAVAYLFGFDKETAAAFGALAGSWMGGTANMIAVGSALHVSEDAFAYALVVDSVNYTLWVMLLLFLVPFAKIFNRFTKSEEKLAYLDKIGCACSMGAKRYWLLILLALGASLLSQIIAEKFVILNTTTSIVLFSTLLGVLGSFTKLRFINGSNEVATTMLYILIALIGSRAVIENFSGLGMYVLAGFTVLLVHAFIMVVGAKIFKLDLFSISVASLANIGGVASAPILAATYNKALVSIGVLMAIMGYLIGTFGGLLVGYILILFI
ncbi:DUF819 domain-containing protein [Sulfurimonas sediminis]|uniref:DUF819 domain-containing protein n=1 Tax=Sulfurimonas sediminis TaxID=2590020 RepID=A0A7M1AZH7_9BACT|nr:DUF819 family protein [Sulfurimonas sediminis]QOP42861.1 DUF819 domain-containing protein [Sulfurimonas sediminis]